jgi:hypothetical protein
MLREWVSQYVAAAIVWFIDPVIERLNILAN